MFLFLKIFFHTETTVAGVISSELLGAWEVISQLLMHQVGKSKSIVSQLGIRAHDVCPPLGFGKPGDLYCLLLLEYKIHFLFGINFVAARFIKFCYLRFSTYTLLLSMSKNNFETLFSIFIRLVFLTLAQ